MPLMKKSSADVKGKTRRYFEISLLLSLFLLVAAFKFFPATEQKTAIINANQEIITIEDIANTSQETKPPPPPKPPIAVEAPPGDPGDTIDYNPSPFPPPGPPPPLPTSSISSGPANDDEDYIDVFEEQPTIIGGLRAIQERLTYPELAIRAGIEGPITIKAFVDKHGNVAKAELVRGIGGGCDEAALQEVLKAKFTPGMQRGIPVNTKIAIRLRFTLTNK